MSSFRWIEKVFSLHFMPKSRGLLRDFYIPLHREAYGKPASEIQGLFGVKGKNALFVNKGQGLVAMYALVNRVIQKRDESMMPSDSSFKNALGKRFIDEVE